MHWIYYPDYVIGDDSITPDIRLPPDYEEKLPEFYEREGKEKIEDAARALERSLDKLVRPDSKILLNWDDKKGLVNIAVNEAHSLDLNDDDLPAFQPTNMENVLYAHFAGIIAMKYIRKLLLTQPTRLPKHNSEPNTSSKNKKTKRRRITSSS
jgi:hypothetical protein